MGPADAGRLTLLASVWGSSYLFIKLALADLTPLQIVWARLGLGAAVLIVISVSSRIEVAGTRSSLGPLVVMALFANIAPFLLITWGEERISTGLTAILNSTTPLFTAAIAALVVPGERLYALRVAGILVGFAGVIVIVGGPAEAGAVAGALAVVVASLSYGVGFVYARVALTNRGHSILALSTAQLFVAAVLLAPVSAWDVIAHPPSVGLTSGLSVTVLGAVGTGLAYILYYRLVSDVGATTASFVTFLIPVFGVALGFLVLGERVSWNTLVGAVFVIAGIALAERGPPRRAAEAVPPESP
jgi:drug/metabolite transporter (DMT)-like permease